MSLSDQILLRKFLKGNRDAFDTLYRRYAPRVHATSCRITGNWEDAEEVLQDVFVALAREAARLIRLDCVGTWIYRTAVNRSIDRLRSRRATFHSLDAPETNAAHIISVASVQHERVRQESADRERLILQIERLIPRLPERQAAVLVLRGFQGLSHSAIAEILECTESTSKSHYSLACRQMRTWMAGVEAGELPLPNEKEASS